MNISRRKNNQELDLFKPFDELEMDFQKLFNAIWLGDSRWSGLKFKKDIAIDIKDKGDRYIVEADLPGLEKKDLKVSINDDIVTIQAERQKEKGGEKKGEYYYERSYGSFEKSFRLASEINAKEAKASLKKGVLSLELPKKKSSEAKEAEIAIED